MSFSKIFDVVIIGSPLASKDHCYVLVVPDLFESRSLYVHTLFSKSSDQEFLLKFISAGKTFWENPDDPDQRRIIRPKLSAPNRVIRPCPGSSGPQSPEPSGQVRIIRPYPGSSGPDSQTIYRPGGGGALTPVSFSTAATFSPQKLHAVI